MGVVALPGLPKARLNALLIAFRKVAKNPEAIAAAKKRKMDWGDINWQPQQAHAKLFTNAEAKLFKRVRKLIN